MLHNSLIITFNPCKYWIFIKHFTNGFEFTGGGVFPIGTSIAKTYWRIEIKTLKKYCSYKMLINTFKKLVGVFKKIIFLGMFYFSLNKLKRSLFKSFGWRKVSYENHYVTPYKVNHKISVLLPRKIYQAAKQSVYNGWEVRENPRSG